MPDEPAGRWPVHEEDAFEDDPTGMRALLRALPDPGPMPEELVRRIEERLAVEQSHRTREQGQTSPTALRHSEHLVDLAAERSHRRPARTLAVLGAAAAGLMLTTVAINQLIGPGGPTASDNAAFAPSSSRAGADSAGSAGSADGAQDREDSLGSDGAAAESAPQPSADGDDAAAGGGAADDDGSVPPRGDQSIVLVPELGELPDLGEDPTGFASLIHGAAQDVWGNGSTTPDSSTPLASNFGVAQANSCWEATADPTSWDSYFAATAVADGAPVVVLLGLQSDGEGHAWVLPAACAQDADIPPLADAAIQP